MSRPLRVLLILFAAFVALIVAIDRLAPEPSGPEGSSYATAPAGAAAYAELLHRAGHAVRRVRAPLADDAPAPGEALVILDPERVEAADADAIGRFLAAGGRLVAAGATSRWLERALDAPPAWGPGAAGDARTVVPVPETAGVRTVRFTAGGRWEELGGALPILAGPDGPVGAVAVQGEGRAVLLPDASPFANAQLADADNAAFALDAVGGRPVAFLETVHGYGEATGIAALPDRAVWALALLALAGLALVWSMARRFGPPEEDAVALAPPRRDYVEAVAAALAATGDRPGIADAAARAGRRRLAERAGLPPAADEPALRDAAARLGLTPEEADALFGDDELGAGRALARVSGIMSRR